MNEVVTKREIVIEIANRTSLRQVDIQQVIDEFTNVVSGKLAKGDDVVLRGFGAFRVKGHKPRKGRNPMNPEHEIVIPARAAVKFETGKKLKEQVATLTQVNGNEGKWHPSI